MAQSIFIPRSNLARAAATIKVGVNGKFTTIPTGQTYVASDDEVAALQSAGVPISETPFVVPAGTIVLPKGRYGAQLPIQINGRRQNLRTGDPITVSAEILLFLVQNAIEFMGERPEFPDVTTPTLPVPGGTPLSASPNNSPTYGPINTMNTPFFDTQSKTHAVSFRDELGINSRRTLLGAKAQAFDNGFVITDIGDYYLSLQKIVNGTVTALPSPYETYYFRETRGTAPFVDTEYALDRGDFVIRYNNKQALRIPKSVMDGAFGESFLGNVAMLATTYSNDNTRPNQNVTIRGGQSDPLLVDSISIDADGYVTAEIRYVSAGPVIPVMQIERVSDSSVIRGHAPMDIVINSSPGSAVVKSSIRVSELSSPFNYRLGMRVGTTDPANAATRVTRFSRTPVPTIGQNLAELSQPTRSQRVYTNMLAQGYVQDVDKQKFLSWSDGSGKLDFLGNPMVSDLCYMHGLPDSSGVYPFEFKWTSGEVDSILPESPSGGPGYTEISARTRVNANTIRFTARINRGGEAAFGRLIVRFANSQNPPKGLSLTLVGESLSDRFVQPFIDFNKRIGGYYRDMDGQKPNAAIALHLLMTDWSKRALPNRIGAQIMTPLEDTILLSQLTKRPIWHNVSPSFAWTDAGRDFNRRAAAMLWDGTGSNLGFGVYKAQKMILECGNETWNEGGLGPQSSYQYYKQILAPQLGLPTDSAREADTRVTCHIRTCRRVLDDFYSAWPKNMIQHDLGFQMEVVDVQRFVTHGEWPSIAADTPAGALAPYVPGDPNAGFAPGQQPASLSPEDIVAWFRAGLRDRVASFKQLIQLLALNNMTTDVYEWNIARGAIAGMTADQERALKSSQVFYDFCLNELIPGIASIGGNSAVYSDVGVPSDVFSWFWFESPIPGGANGGWNALVEWARLNNKRPVA